MRDLTSKKRTHLSERNPRRSMISVHHSKVKIVEGVNDRARLASSVCLPVEALIALTWSQKIVYHVSLLHNISFHTVIKNQGFAYKEALATLVDFVLADMLFCSRRVGDDVNSSHPALFLVTYRPFKGMTITFSGLELQTHDLPRVAVWTMIQSNFQKSRWEEQDWSVWFDLYRNEMSKYTPVF